MFHKSHYTTFQGETFHESSGTLYDFMFLVNITRVKFLNQAHASHRPARTWFLKIDPVRIVSMCVCVCVFACVCVSAPKAINN